MAGEDGDLFLQLVVVALDWQPEVREQGFFGEVGRGEVLLEGEMGEEGLEAGLQVGGELLVLGLVVAGAPVVAFAVLAALYFYYQHYYSAN